MTPKTELLPNEAWLIPFGLDRKWTVEKMLDSGMVKNTGPMTRVAAKAFLKSLKKDGVKTFNQKSNGLFVEV